MFLVRGGNKNMIPIQPFQVDDFSYHCHVEYQVTSWIIHPNMTTNHVFSGKFIWIWRIVIYNWAIYIYTIENCNRLPEGCTASPRLVKATSTLRDLSVAELKTTTEIILEISGPSNQGTVPYKAHIFKGIPLT